VQGSNPGLKLIMNKSKIKNGPDGFEPVGVGIPIRINNNSKEFQAQKKIRIHQ